MFLDEKQLLVTAGKGGDGAVLFRREIYVPRGGPDGGDGGRGGDVIAVAKHNLHALTHLSSLDRIEAEAGMGGGHKRSSGKSGAPSYLEVPVGTQLYEIALDGSDSLIAELLEDGATHVLAKGGNGGWGNWHFRSSVNQAPDRANLGQPGKYLTVRLVLKLIADIGLIGFPNAGKSTLLSVISAAQPKIANYPFTTLEPQLGVATYHEHQWVVADLPGLIEGASEGKGLGDAFLKHIERTKTVVHCIDASQPSEAVVAAYKAIRHELAAWSQTVAEKPELIVLTKTDASIPELIEETLAALATVAGATPVIAISAASHQGLEQFYQSLISLTAAEHAG